MQFLQQHVHTILFVPRVPPLGRPATNEDVKKGKAIFSLEGKRRVAKLRLPAVGRLADEWVLIVQAEVAEQKTVYGVIGNGIRKRVRASELSNVKPIKKSFSFFNLFNR